MPSFRQIFSRRSERCVNLVASGTSTSYEAGDFLSPALDELRESGKISDFDLVLLRQSKALAHNEDAAVLAVPGTMVKGIIDAKYTPDLKAAFSKILGKTINNLVITVDEGLVKQNSATTPGATPKNIGITSPLTSPNGMAPRENNPNPENPNPNPSPTTPNTTPTGNLANPATIPAPIPTSMQIDRNTGLNPMYTFESFVIGSSNSFTAAAAESVVVSPAQAYNPLFIYGGSGLGKTHLLHAIGNYALELYPQAKVRYVSSEEFTNDFINAIATQTFPELQAKYREVDFLLIDDIQFLQGKEQTLEEFFHTFNTLHTARKQVVITSDVPPKELKSFEERIKSRLEWGLLTDIQPPNLETRIAILRRKSAQEDLQGYDDAVLEYIASNISSNIRELEGALLRVTAYAALSGGGSVSLDTAKEILRDFITGRNTRDITPQMIIEQTAQYFGLEVDEIMSTDRSRTVVNSRQVAMYLCRELTELSLPKVGEAFGGRDHTTVMHAVKKIEKTINEDSQTYQSITEITNQIRRAAVRG